MNWFVVVAGVLYLGAAVNYYINGNNPLCVAFVAYAVANFALAIT